MADNQIILEFVADTSGIAAASAQMERLTSIAKDQLAAFQKLNTENEARIKAAIKSQRDLGKAIDGSTDSAKDLFEAARAIPEVLGMQAMADAITGMASFTREIANNIAELQALTEQLNSAMENVSNLAAQNKQATAEYEEQAKQVTELTSAVEDMNSKITEAGGSGGALTGLKDALTGVHAALGFLSKAAKMAGDDVSDFQKIVDGVGDAIDLISSAQSAAETAITKGNAAITAFGEAIATVEAVQQSLKISALAVWGAIAGGIALAVAAVYNIVESYNDADAAATAYEKHREEEAKKERDEALRLKKEQIAALTEADREFFHQQERDRLERLAQGQKEKDVEFDQLTKAIERFQGRINSYKKGYFEYEGLKPEEEKARIDQLTDYINEATIKRNAILKQAEEKRAKDSNAAIAKQIQERKKSSIEEIKEFTRGIEDATANLTKSDKIREQMLATGKEMSDKITEGFKNSTMEKVPEIPVKLTVSPKNKQLLTEEVKSTLKMVAQVVVQVAQEISNAVFEIEANNRQARLDADISLIEKRKEHELLNKNLTEAQVAAINDRYRRQEAAAKLKAWKADQQAAEAKAGIDMALAIVNAWATSSSWQEALARSIAAAAAGAAAIAIIAAKKPPQFEKGGKNIPAGMKIVGEKGPELIWTPGGETIIPHGDTAKILEAWNIPMPKTPEGLNTDIAIGPALPVVDYRKMAQAFAEELRNNPRVNVNIDKNGIHVHVASKNRKVEVLNNYYDR